MCRWSMEVLSGCRRDDLGSISGIRFFWFFKLPLPHITITTTPPSKLHHHTPITPHHYHTTTSPPHHHLTTTTQLHHHHTTTTSPPPHNYITTPSPPPHNYITTQPPPHHLMHRLHFADQVGASGENIYTSSPGTQAVILKKRRKRKR